MRYATYDQKTSDDYRLVVTKIIDLYNARYPALLGYQTDLAKWMIATLSLVNVGWLAALLHENRIPKSAEVMASPFFALGVALALICGLLSWANTNIAIQIYDDIINPNAITNPSDWKVVTADDPRRKHIVHLAWLAVVSGILSLIAAGVGGVMVWFQLK